MLHGHKICFFLQAVVMVTLTRMLGIVLLFSKPHSHSHSPALSSTHCECTMPPIVLVHQLARCVELPLQGAEVALSSISVNTDRK